MTPTHYTRRILKTILNGNNYSLYHWSPVNAAMNIIKEGFIYSKATLFGLYYPNMAMLSHIKRSNALSEAQHGFTDYVFLGNTNWIADGATCYYGNVCFVIRPEKILPFREFFVFPFNTGRYLSCSDDTQQVSDLSILVQALGCQHPCYEILVRRRLKISSKYVKEILCDSGLVETIKHELSENSINDIPVKPHDLAQITRPNMNNDFDSIEIIDPLDKDQKYHTYKRGDFIQKDNMLYVRTQFSSCTLEVKIVDGEKLVDPYSKKQIGQIKSKVIETSIRK